MDGKNGWEKINSRNRKLNLSEGIAYLLGQMIHAVHKRGREKSLLNERCSSILMNTFSI